MYGTVPTGAYLILLILYSTYDFKVRMVCGNMYTSHKFITIVVQVSLSSVGVYLVMKRYRKYKLQFETDASR